METSPNHLPSYKQGELKKITEYIKEASKGIEMIILFGSYATGKYVDRDRQNEGHLLFVYRSDYDIFIVVNDKKLEKNITLWSRVEEVIANDKTIKTPVSLEIDTIHFFNEQLSVNQYFYRDVKRQGVLLYDSKKFSLANAKRLSPKVEQKLRKKDFVWWSTKAQGFFKGYEFYLQEEENNLAFFMLHQATESAYVTFLLVFTGYRPKTHDLAKLRKQIERIDKSFRDILPTKTRRNQRLFDLLRRGYVDARFKNDYHITKKELTTLASQIETLMEKVKEKCLALIGELC